MAVAVPMAWRVAVLDTFDDVWMVIVAVDVVAPWVEEGELLVVAGCEGVCFCTPDDASTEAAASRL